LVNIYTESDSTDKDRLMQLYQEFNCSRIDYNTIKWRTVQFFTTLNTAILAASVTLITFKGTTINSNTRYILSLLPLNVIAISLLAIWNLKRESKLLWEQEASMFKIEKYLGFHDQIDENKRWLKEDDHFVPPKNYNPSYRSKNNKLSNEEPKNLNQWIALRWEDSEFRVIMTLVFAIEGILAFILVVLLM
jgi:hypothetical protein